MKLIFSFKLFACFLLGNYKVQDRYLQFQDFGVKFKCLYPFSVYEQVLGEIHSRFLNINASCKIEPKGKQDDNMVREFGEKHELSCGV